MLLFLNENRTPASDFFFKYGTALGEEPAFLISGIVCLFFRIRLGLFIGVIGLAVTFLSYILKNLFAFKRPLMFYSEMGFENQLNFIDGVHVVTGLTSFPSGHTMAAFALFSFLAFIFPKKKGIAFLFFILALIVGISRIYLVQHFLEDVILGSIIGVLLGLGLHFLYKRFAFNPQNWIEKPLFKFNTLLFFLLISNISVGQIDTSLTMEPIEINASKSLEYDFGSNAQVVDSQLIAAYSSSSLSEVLSQQSGMFIKSYGLGSLATVSSRGSGASHTPVLWNGFNLQNSMNGVVDFSLMPISFTDEIIIQYGGGSSLQGSGAMGGAILMNNNPDWGKKFSFNTHNNFGSFNNWHFANKIGFGNQKFHSNVQLTYKEAVNDFKLKKNNNTRQTNAALQQIGIGQNNFWKIGKYQILKSFFWFQDSNREIPPSRTEAASDAKQEDRAIRAAIEWNYIKGKSQTKIRAGYFGEELLFFSSLIDSSFSKMDAFIIKADEVLFLKKDQKLTFGIDYNFQNAEARLINGTKNRNRIGWKAGYQVYLFKKKMKWVIQIREELVDNELVPLTASTGMLFKLNKQFQLNANFSKDYNLPTFNDLYWQDVFALGNENLKPESGWSEEIGIQYLKSSKKWEYRGKLNFFNSNYQNWILWIRNDQGVFQPENKRAVWARGLESMAAIKTTFGNLEIETILRYHFTKSTIEKIQNDSGSNQLKKQLIYTPVHLFKGNLSITYQNFSLNYHHQFTGKRQTTRDNNDLLALPSYQLADLSLVHYFSLKNANCSLRFNLHNLWNVEFEVIAARPMPLRNFEIGFNMTI